MIRSAKTKIILSLFLVIILTGTSFSPAIKSEIVSENNQVVMGDYLEFPVISLTSDQDFITYAVPGNGTAIDPYIIEYVKVFSTAETALYIGHVTKHFIIRNSIIRGTVNGILLFNCTGSALLQNNTINSFDGTAIITILSRNVTIANNICENNINGIIVDDCPKAVIGSNKLGFNTYPLSVYSSHYSFIFNNTLDYNKDRGILIYESNSTVVANNSMSYNGGGYQRSNIGSALYYSWNSTFTNNTILESEVGLYVFASVECEISYNAFIRNEEYGLQNNFYDMDYPSANNTFHHNFFIANAEGSSYWYNPTSQAVDSGFGSIWYDKDTNEGNYWSNYTGVGEYSIDGSREYTDPYPIEAVDSDSDGLDDMIETFVYFSDPNDNDTDNDLLFDGEEVEVYGTNPTKVDTDYDMLYDGDEVYNYTTSPLNRDTDYDGLTDGAEVLIFATNPKNRDTDNDDIFDGWEVINGLDPHIDDAAEDPDEDGLINIDEFLSLTDPHLNDTDGDTLYDGDEVNTYYSSPHNPDTDSDDLIDGEEVHIYGTDPLSKDSDRDGIHDGVEVLIYSTLPNINDTDSDGMPDGFEVYNGLNPLVKDGLDDLDDDGLANIDEYLIGTDPMNPDSDEDGFLDGHEVRVGRDPLLIIDHPWYTKGKIQLGVGIGIISALFLGIPFYVLVKKKIIFKK